MQRPVTLSRLVSVLMSLLLFAGGAAPPATAQERKPISIKFGQPNIWSLEQAHYLLARMRARNLGIQGQELADADLDPNETAGTRLRQLRQSLGVGVGFDAVAGLNNELFEQESRFKRARREQLISLRDQRQLQLTETTVQLHALQLDKERMKLAGAKDPELALKQLEIDQKTTEKTQLENHLSSMNTELAGLSITATPVAPNVPTPQTTPAGESVLDKLLGDQKFRDDIANDMPELNASTKLDNYLDFQTELIAKQLTLLRDELGPGERLLFLELPQSLYTVPDKSNRKLAQVWWHVDGYYIKPAAAPAVPPPAAAANSEEYREAYAGLSDECWREIVAEREARKTLVAAEYDRRTKSKAAAADIKRRREAAYDELKKSAKPEKTEAELRKGAEDKVYADIRAEVNAAFAEQGDPRAQQRRLMCNPYSGERPRNRAEVLKEIERRQSEQFTRKLAAVREWEKKNNLAEKPYTSRDFEPENYYYDVNAANENNGAIRTVDLIPRQSAFNVNDIQDKQKNFNLAGLFTFLSGFGARVDYQRQRRLYEQFITQDTYASAFGKGDSEFGWTFGPKPGTERIATGLHTTFAILVVPEQADTIKLTARGCYFPRTGYAPNSFGETNERSLSGNASSVASLDPNIQCTADETFRLPIPSATENSFWVTGVEYKSVRPGERAVVYVRGDYFSPQVGVLVDGVPLRQTVGLAQVSLAGAPRDNGFQPSPRGDFEFVNSKLLVLAFTMPRNARGEEYKGTPTIALVTPGGGRIINDVRLVVNESYKCLKEQAGDPEKPDTNCPCLAYENGDKTKACKVVERYKRLPEPPGLDRKNSIFVELSDQPALFSDLPKAASLEIGDLKILGTDSRGVNTAYLTGSKFDPRDELRINGVRVECTKTVGGAPVACAAEDLVAAAEGKGASVGAACSMGGVAVACPEHLGKNLMRIQFEVSKEPALDVTIVHREPGKDAQVASKQFRNDQLPRVERFTIVEYQKKNKPALLKLYLEGVGFRADQKIVASPLGVNVRQERIISPTSMALDIELKDQVQFVRLDIVGSDASKPSTTVVISLPVDPPEEPTTDRRRRRDDPSAPGN